jgi:hypothetical protein
MGVANRTNRKGSSFDQCKFDNKAQEMDVLNRWKCYENDKVQFWDVLALNKELMELSNKIFGPPPWEK